MRVQDIDTGLQELERELFSAMMDPEPARPDWAERRPRIITMCDKALTLFTALERAQSLLGAKERESWMRRAGELANQLVALLHAAGEAKAQDSLLRAGLRVAPVGPLQDELEAARRAPELHLALARARWLHDRERHAEARVLLDKVIAGDEAILVDSAELVEAVEAPLEWTWRGCGFGLYGHDQERPDRSYLTTYCMQVFWMPVWPLARYRVRKTREGLFFMGRLALGAGWRFVRAASVAALLGLIALVAVSAWLDRPARRLSQALSEAARLERSGPPERAERRYLELAEKYRNSVAGSALAPIATALVRIELARKQPPASPPALAGLNVLIARVRGLPRGAWSGGAGPTLAQHLEQVASTLEAQGEAGIDSALGLLDDAARFASTREAMRLRQHRDQLRRTRAEGLADDWPLLAVERLGDLGDDASARTRQGELLLRLSATAGLISEVEPATRDFLRWARPRAELAGTVRKLEAALEAAGALAMDADRNRALESGDPAALSAALRSHPADQAIQAGLATAQAASDRSAALARLDKLGRPGWLVGHARLALIGLILAGSDLTRAGDLLSHEVSFRLPHFRAALQAYDVDYQALAKRLAQRAEYNQLPDDLARKLRFKPLEVQQRLFAEWVERTAEDDANLTLLRGRAQREAVVVDLALQLGTLQLERASTAPSAQRAALLASAERAFLAIAGEADDRPDYHLGLGQAYYRLGRVDEARRELDGLLAGGDPALEFRVAFAYRSVGLTVRAREIAIAATKRDEPWRTEAALMLAVMAETTDETANWLGQADPNNSEVKHGLRKVAAERALKSGRLDEADGLLAALIEDIHTRPVTLALLNDEALALSNRFTATGRPDFLDQAIVVSDRVQKLAPDDAVLIGNLIALLQHRARIGVLADRLELGALRLSDQHSETILMALLEGDQDDTVRAALLRAPTEVRAVGLLHRMQALAPYTPRGYQLEREATELRQDVAGLTALVERLRTQELDSSEVDEWRKGWQSGAHDAQLRDQARSTLANHQAAAGARDPATAAAAQLVIAYQLRMLAQLDLLPAQARDAVTALRSAGRWKALGVQRVLAVTLLMQAMLEAAASDPAIEAVLRRDRREFSESQLLAHLPAAARTALASRPEVVEAVTLLRAAAAREPSETDLVVARALGDTELERLAVPVLDRPLERLGRELGKLLDPHGAAAAELAALKP